MFIYILFPQQLFVVTVSGIVLDLLNVVIKNETRIVHVVLLQSCHLRTFI